MPSKYSITVTLLVFTFHLINSLLRNSYHDPDEYWQSVEIAHAKVFGYGYVTWEWQQHIRSSFFVWIWVFMYKMIKHLGLDEFHFIMHFIPKLIMSIFVTASDISMFLLSRNTYGPDTAICVIIASLFNVFNMVYSTRTLSNSLEMVLTTFGIASWPYNTRSDVSSKTLISCLFIHGLSCMVRPTAMIIWIVPYLILIWNHRHNKMWILNFFLYCTLMVSLILGLQIFIDSEFYSDISQAESFIFTPYNFLKKNLIDGLSKNYGTMPWYWYITYGVPFMLTTWIPFFIMGAYESWIVAPSLTNFLIKFFSFGVFFNSFIQHKEFRFIHPLLPALTPIVGCGIAKWISKGKKRMRVPMGLVFLCLFNFMISIALNRYHNCGIVPTMDRIIEMTRSSEGSFMFLMPCHSTPWLSYIHNPHINMTMLTCDYSHQGDKLDQTTAFYSAPTKSLESLINGFDYIVIFESLLNEISEDLKRIQKRDQLLIIWKRFNSMFSPDDRRVGDILIIDNRLDERAKKTPNYE